jgi:hypothetical protein
VETSVLNFVPKRKRGRGRSLSVSIGLSRCRRMADGASRPKPGHISCPVKLSKIRFVFRGKFEGISLYSQVANPCCSQGIIMMHSAQGGKALGHHSSLDARKYVSLYITGLRSYYRSKEGARRSPKRHEILPPLHSLPFLTVVFSGGFCKMP